MKDIDIHIVRSHKELEKVFTIRRTVFMEEMNVSPELEFDGLDDHATHVLMTVKKQPIGCARLRQTDQGMKLERVAILPRYRKKGFGAMLMNYLLQYCQQHHYHFVYLYAQINACEFYKQFGFQPRGDVFIEAGITHQAMEKTL